MERKKPDLEFTGLLDTNAIVEEWQAKLIAMLLTRDNGNIGLAEVEGGRCPLLPALREA
ncbi:MAG: hypothetical protein M1830_002376, partial [Pleopsidium flavum]